MNRPRSLSPASTNPPAAVLERQARLNQSTAGNWKHFSTHRLRVTELILSTQPGGRLGVFGAGNCNDLDLPRLAAEFAEVHLLDLDAEALARGIERQGASGVHLHPGTDLSGIAGLLDSYRNRGFELALDNLIERARAGPRLDFAARFDVVVSTTVLTQLLNAALAVLGSGHPRLDEVFTALRTAHVRLLAECLRPGGAAILITDIASSQTCPGLAKISPAELPSLAERLEQENRLFAGVSAAQIESQLRNDPYLAARIEDVRRIGPWQWRIGSKTTYLVLAFLFRRNEDGTA